MTTDAATRAYAVLFRHAAERDRELAYEWWVATHGPIAPSRLELELVAAFALLARNPELGFGSGYRGHSVRKYPLSCGFFVVYKVRPRRREVVILRILAASRLHG